MRRSHTRSPARIAYAALSLAALTLGAHALGAQQANAVALTGRVSGSGYLQGTEPKGDFGKNTGNGFGVGGTLLLALEPSALVNFRTDLSIVSYGSNTRRIDLAGTGGLVKLDLRTTSNIFSMVGGPQLGGAVGPIMPYAAALGGFSVFWTESSVEGSRNASGDSFASTTNASDFVMAYGGAAGMLVRVYNGRRPIRIDFGARLLRHDEVRYLNEDRVQDGFENNRDPVPIRGRADFATYYIGVNAILF